MISKDKVTNNIHREFKRKNTGLVVGGEPIKKYTCRVGNVVPHIIGNPYRYGFESCLYILKNTYEGTTTRSRSGRDLLNDDTSSKQGPSKRQLRVSNLIQIDLQEIIHEGYTIKTKDEIEDKLRKKISVVDVDVSPDLAQAKVFVSIYGETFEKREAYIWLVKNTKKIRHALVQKLKGMKRVPEIRFKQTDLSKGVDMYVLLENLEEERIENEKKRKENEQQVYLEKKTRQEQLKKRMNKIDYEGLGINPMKSTSRLDSHSQQLKYQDDNGVDMTNLTSNKSIIRKGTINEEDVDRILATFSTADSLDWGDEKEEDIEEKDLAVYDLNDLDKAYIEDLSEEKDNDDDNDDEDADTDVDDDDDDEDFDWVDEEDDDEEDNDTEDEMEDNDTEEEIDEEWGDINDDHDDYEIEQRMKQNKKRQNLGRKPRISVGGEEFAEEEEDKWIM